VHPPTPQILGWGRGCLKQCATGQVCWGWLADRMLIPTRMHIGVPNPFVDGAVGQVLVFRTSAGCLHAFLGPASTRQQNVPKPACSLHDLRDWALAVEVPDGGTHSTQVWPAQSSPPHCVCGAGGATDPPRAWFRATHLAIAQIAVNSNRVHNLSL